MADFIGQAESAVLSAGPQEIQAHRSFLSEALSAVEQRGNDPSQVTQQAGAGNAEPAEMTPAQLASTTLQLARQHPDIVKAIGDRFPEAQSLLGCILGPQGNVGGFENDAIQEVSGLVGQ